MSSEVLSGQPALASLGERRLVSQVLGRRYGAMAWFGDDCAVIPQLPSRPFELVATTDPGPEPLGLLVSYLLPEGLPVSDFERLMDGVDDSCRAHGSAVIGGNLGDAPFTQLSATALG